MKCNKCGVDKPESEYYADRKRKSGLSTICKDCVRKAVKERASKNKEAIRLYHREYYAKHRESKIKQDIEYREKIRALKTSCVKCGEARPYVIDFHHIDPSTKSFNINRKSCKSNFAELEDEVKKCVCLCRNCHAEFHYLYGTQPKHPKESLDEYLNEKVLM